MRIYVWTCWDGNCNCNHNEIFIFSQSHSHNEYIFYRRRHSLHKNHTSSNHTFNTSSVGFRTKTKKGSLCICSYWLSTVGTVGFLGNIIVTNRTGMTRFLLSLHSLTDFFLEFLGVFLRNCSYGVCCTEEAPPVSLFVELKSVANRSWWSGHTSLSLLPVGESGNTSLKKV